VLDALELAGAVVDDPLDDNGLELPGPLEREERRRPGVVEDGRGEQDPLPARGAVRDAEPGERILAPRLALLDRGSVQNALAAVPVRLVQD
jgi:hypothetical protein